MNRTARLLTLITCLGITACSNSQNGEIRLSIPENIRAIFNKLLYSDSIWALRVVDLESGEILLDQHSEETLYIGSVRKVFTMSEALEAMGPDFQFRTPIHRQGSVNAEGVLEGNLVLVASGDITMGGRRSPAGTMAFTDLDHNEANTLGNAELTKPDPLWGYNFLAEQVAASGVKAITGDVIIDGRLFKPFEFRGEFDVKPIFVNDDVVDVTMRPTNPGELALVDHNPKSLAFGVDSNLITVSQGVEEDPELIPEFPACIGSSECFGSVIGGLAIDFLPPLTHMFPYVQTFRIVEPDNYARTVFIEALERAGVAMVNAEPVGPNRSGLLPPKDSYTPDTLLAELVSLPFSEYAKFILKVSYNIGAETSLVLWGLTEGVESMEDALVVERENLTQRLGISGDDFQFIDGSGGGETTANNKAVIQLLKYTSEQSYFPEFLDALPILAVDGSLSSITEFESDPSLAGAKGNVFAKTGTYAAGNEIGIVLKGRSMAGYIDAKSGRRLMYSLIVENTQLGPNIESMLEVFQDQGTITALIWRDN